MDLSSRKYHFIQELINVDKETIMDALERVLKKEKEQHQEISSINKQELDKRIESYKNNSSDLLDWEDIKDNW
ncbi:Putative addiction module component [Tenacibaculum sp. 190524A02b]|uniref:addiction module protein n=1 Tax=Tenacibaculum vairaonense TaxID=3137860 RepID=UPI0032B2FB28